MKSSRPYFIRALLDWIVDSDCTPYLLIAANAEGVSVPQGYVRDGRIVLNLSAAAVRNFHLDDAALSFDSRFGGQPFHVVAPLGAVAAVYAKENGEGMTFEVESPSRPPPDDAEPPKGAPNLKIVK